MLEKTIMLVKGGFTVLLLFFIVGCSGTKTINVQKPEETVQKGNNESEKVQNFNYLFMEAVKQKMEGNYELALKYFNGCIQLYPDDDAVNYQLSQIWAIGGKPAIAEKYGWKAIASDPDNIWYYFQLAQIYQHDNNMDTVMVIYKKMIDKFPERTDIKYTLAQLYSDHGDYKEALGMYNSFVKNYGYSIDLGLALEEVYEKSNQMKKAEAETDKLLKLYPDNITVLGIRAELFSKMGEKDKAEKIYQKLLNENTDNEKILMSYIEHRIRFKENTGLKKLIEELLKSKNLDDIQKSSYVQALMMNVKNDSTIRTILRNSTMKWITGDSVVFQAKASFTDYLIKENDDHDALLLLKDITVNRPEILAAWQQLGILEQKVGVVDSLIQDMYNAIEYHPEDPVLYLLGASGLLQANEGEKAVEMLNDGLQNVNKENVAKALKVQYYGLLGDAYNEQKDYKESVRYYNMALKIDPENSPILNNYSYYLALRKERLNDALQMSKKTIESEPDNPTYLDTYGWILFQMGKVKEAEKHIKKALDKDYDQSAEVYEHYGDILKKLGRDKEAFDYWKKALLLDPENKQLKEKIEGENDK